MQSDWLSAFLHLNWEPDFSQTCGFNRIIKVIIVHDLNPKKSTHFFFFFLQNPKNPIFGHYPQNEIFSQKCSSVSFLCLRYPNFMRNFRKILWAVLEKPHLLTDILTYWQWWNHTIPFGLKGGIQKPMWYKQLLLQQKCFTVSFCIKGWHVIGCYNSSKV